MMEPIKIQVEVTINVLVNGRGDRVDTVVVHDDYSSNEIPTLPPIITQKLYCYHWLNAVGDKPEKSCEGCKVACPVKGRYKGESVPI